MLLYGVILWIISYFVTGVRAECRGNQLPSYVRWIGVSPERTPPVFVYSASGDEESLAGACLARCRELEDCAGVAVAYAKGNCHGVAYAPDAQLSSDSDVSYFKKICLELPGECSRRWWAVEVTPGYHLHSEDHNVKVLLNTTIEKCYEAVVDRNRNKLYRSAQWSGVDGVASTEVFQMSDGSLGNCVLNKQDKFTEPESYRVSNYYTLYLENQCRYDYPKKIDRCSYEEYYNQTLKHVELTLKNFTKDECKKACEDEDRFVCRGFTWVERHTRGDRGLCDLHSEDLVTTGSWLLRRTGPATYYHRVICLNISVECDSANIIVTYRPRGSFRGRVYVPGRGERCSARARDGGVVRLSLPLTGECDVNFALGITNSPNGVINRTMAYVMVMIQNNPIIQTAGDRWVRVGCSPGGRATTQVDATVAIKESKKPSQVSESASAAIPSAASAVFGANVAPLSMYVVRVQEDSAAASGGAVSLGEPLEIRIESTDDNEIEAYHLVASSRLGDSSVLLLDNKGCPTNQVDFPPFTRSWLGGTQRLSARFKAFRFPTSHVVRFAVMVRFCDGKCITPDCGLQQGRSARGVNESSYEWNDEEVKGAIREEGWKSFQHNAGGVVAQGGAVRCEGASDGRVPLEVEMVVGSRDILSADTLVRADHQATITEESKVPDGSVVCVHELLLLALALAWLAVQVVLLVGCCVLVKRYRNLAEMSMQKDYQSFDNVGFDTVSTHRRVHWPDQDLNILHAT